MIGVGTWVRELREVWMKWEILLLKVLPRKKRRRRRNLGHGSAQDKIMATIDLEEVLDREGDQT